MAYFPNGRKSKRNRKKQQQKAKHNGKCEATNSNSPPPIAAIAPEPEVVETSSPNDEETHKEFIAVMKQVKRLESVANISELRHILDNVNESLGGRDLSIDTRSNLIWDLRLVHSICGIYSNEFQKLTLVRNRFWDRVNNDPDYLKSFIKKGPKQIMEQYMNKPCNHMQTMYGLFPLGDVVKIDKKYHFEELQPHFKSW